MFIPKTKKSYLVQTLKGLRVTALVIVFTMVAIYQIRVEIASVNKDILNTNKMNSTREFYRDTYELLHRQIPGIINTKNIIAAALLPTEDSSEFLELLKTFGTKHSLVIQTNVGETQLETVSYEDIPLRTLPITISVSGPIDNIRSFIYDIEHVPYFFSIVSIDERGVDIATKKRIATIKAKLWTKPDQVITRMQTK